MDKILIKTKRLGGKASPRDSEKAIFQGGLEKLLDLMV
jgi:hypothetical protein